MEEMCRTAVSVSVWMLSSSAINDTTSASLLYSVSTLFSRTSFVWARFFRMFPTYPSNNTHRLAHYNLDNYKSPWLLHRCVNSTIGHLLSVFSKDFIIPGSGEHDQAILSVPLPQNRNQVNQFLVWVRSLLIQYLPIIWSTKIRTETVHVFICLSKRSMFTFNTQCLLYAYR